MGRSCSTYSCTMLSHVETETDQSQFKFLSGQEFSSLLSPEKHPCPSVNPVHKQFLLPKGRCPCLAPAVRLLQGALKEQQDTKTCYHACMDWPPTLGCLSKLSKETPSAAPRESTLDPCCKSGKDSKIWR